MNSEANTPELEEDIPQIEGFGEVEMDAIGEIQNITMGSAATAVSNLLSAKVWITTPRVKVLRAKDLSYPNLEPSVHVKIEYIVGINGTSLLVLKQSDVQLILNQLMGQPLVVTDDFEFDEMNISAVCEVMNQMMGASATALSDLLGVPIDISTPVASVAEAEDSNPGVEAAEGEEYVVQICFDLTIDGVIKSEFISILSIDLAKSMAGKMLMGFSSDSAEEEPAPVPPMSQEDIAAMMNAVAPAPAPEPAPSSSGGSGGMMSQAEIEAMLAGAGGGGAPAPAPVSAPAPAPMPQPQAAPGMPPVDPNQAPYGMPPYAPYAGYPAPPQGQYPQYPPQGQYPPQPPQGQYPPQQPPPGYGGYAGQQIQRGGSVNVQSAQFHAFEDFSSPELSTDQNDNLRLLMGVPLDVSVEIGSAKRKVREILDFTQGTIIELERQAGAPVDIIVNGHLIAHGDVVVIEDNFAVRITEIIKSKFLDSLTGK